MRINVIGGGPAGLYVSILMKKLDPSCRIHLFERDGPNDTYGWGIVFSDKALSYLRDADEPTHQAITRAFATWHNVDIVHRDQKISVRGNRFSGIARVAFLNILQERARELGIELHFRAPVENVGSLRDADLLVGADGANSLVRGSFSEHFEPSLDVRRNKYIWLGTRRLFHGLTIIFRPNEDGLFVAHAYKFNEHTSTFIVECVLDTWDNVGFEALSERETIAYLEAVFQQDLDGNPLLANNFVKWLSFAIVKNRTWHHENVVLLGDAAHTAHFSIGSGTKLALEDAIALASAFRQHKDVAGSLAAYERSRKPIVDDYQEAAESSLIWLESAQEKMNLEPIPLTYELMTRSRKVDYDNLGRRDPEFIALYDRWREQSLPPPRRGS